MIAAKKMARKVESILGFVPPIHTPHLGVVHPYLGTTLPWMIILVLVEGSVLSYLAIARQLIGEQSRRTP